MLNTRFFHTELPARPMGRYAHIVLLRVTEGYALFQTDGELNRARVAAGAGGANAGTAMTRIALFKRKQTTPERLNGRELLRHYNVLSDSNDEKDENACIYNVKACRKCPDCITYGFAIGDGGSEKSKVYSDTAFSLTDYASSHEVFTLNAPFEDGTMSEQGVVSSRINSQDHVKPQTIFPAVITTRDLTLPLFEYVLGNVIRTTRYGATTTRGGTMRNHIAAIVLSDGEIFSNLLFTQRLYDLLAENNILMPNEPVPVQTTLEAAAIVVPQLLDEDGVRNQQVLMGDDLTAYLDSIRGQDENTMHTVLQQAAHEALTYHDKYVAKQGKKK
ncbi:MAG: type I-D CRISPR-associated protein Cas7/Csc2 [Anaerolineae bacterium]|nr:type I-D CRISPR-associated protein Cas7/Csc2 [Anaerolineae bacterium]